MIRVEIKRTKRDKAVSRFRFDLFYFIALFRQDHISLEMQKKFLKDSIGMNETKSLRNVKSATLERSVLSLEIVAAVKRH